MMLNRGNDVELDFDFNKVLEKNKDNPVFYVQYSYARINSLFRSLKISLNKEIKLDLKADYGHGTLTYDPKTKKWGLGGAKTTAAEELRELLNAVGIVKFVNSQWVHQGVPNKGNIPSNSFTQDMVKSD